MTHFFSNVALSMALVVASNAIAQNYPNKPVRIIAPFAAGGAADTFSRTIAQKLSDTWGGVMVDNRPGAGSSIGTAIAARAEPDGYTWMIATFSHTANPYLYRGLPYDTLKDFDTVSLMATAPTVLLLNPAVPAKSVQELIALAKGGGLNFASAGNGSTTHLAGELFKSLTSIPITHVAYRGSAAQLLDLVAGRVQMSFDPLPSTLPYVKSGKLRALAVTSAKRSSVLPDVPSMTEAGVPGFEVNWWAGLVVPSGTFRSVISQINAQVLKILEMPDVKERFSTLGYELVGSTPEELLAFIKTEMAKWEKVIKDANIRIGHARFFDQMPLASQQPRDARG